jgi:ribosomal protein S9
MKATMISGKRKTALAKVKITLGNGAVLYNKKPLTTLFTLHKLALEEPLLIAKHVLGTIPVDLEIYTSGGGTEGQIQAARLAVAKALVSHTKSVELKKAYLHYDRALLVADTRRKEAYKPGDSKARAKRQKSYR